LPWGILDMLFYSVVGMSSLAAESVTDVISHQSYWLACISLKDLHFPLQVPGGQLCTDQGQVSLEHFLFIFILYMTIC
jgi:hypothetical protein